ncbi:MAG: helix-turn-helix domain-containing protein [Acidobacteriota bacterium]|nr:helix-turn-helix domain-containing protein [Acidobacteriota bacterium]
MHETTELLTVREAAARLSIDASTLRRLIRRGVIPHVRLTPRCVRVKASEIQAYIDRSTCGGDVHAAPELRWVRLRPAGRSRA